MLQLLNTSMAYVLFIITLTIKGYSVQLVDSYETMQACFAQREAVVKQLGRPIRDYQAICVQRSL